MTLYTMGSFCPYLDCAPCPPFFVVDIYQILVNVSLSVNLTENDYRAIAKRCSIQEPTTTTSSTTTTSTIRTTSTTQTTSVLTTKEMTSVTNISTTAVTPTSSSTPVSLLNSSVNVSKTSDVSSTKHIPISTERLDITLDITSSASDSGVSTSLPANISSTTERTTMLTQVTGLTTGGSKRRHRWPYCNDVCLIIAITSSTCAFLVLLVVLALCCKRSHPHTANSRSSSSQKLVANGTYERPNTLDRNDGVVWRHTPGIENLAYRKSLEMREPLKYMDSEQNWEDLDYIAAGKDGSLRSYKSSQRGDGSPKRKRRTNKDKRQSSTEKLNQTHGVILIPLSDRKQRSLPKIPTETQSVSEDKEHSYPNGIRFLSLPRPPKERYATEHIREHIRAKSDGQNGGRTKQRPRSYENLSHSKNVYVDIPEYPSQAVRMYSKPNQIRNDLKAKDTNLRQAQNRKPNNSSKQSTKPDCQNPSNHKLGQNISNYRGPNRHFQPEDNVFPAVDSNSSPKFYPPYREPNKQTVMFTTRL